ncbi:hypothetical protein M8009_13000 [Halomonas sp. ATCH28]|uniref:Uncharacterized protein n=1 Tax=Halomonas gemina TaxID=2945105 RepID=A0ABT0T397_9GAMM|nr:hypothetical protein [Halomonas gemina]MCL7941204.1 hypothetical protein [Halomonas gemina]
MSGTYGHNVLSSCLKFYLCFEVVLCFSLTGGVLISYIFFESTREAGSFFSMDSVWVMVASLVGAVVGAGSSYFFASRREEKYRKVRKRIVLDEVEGFKEEAAEWMKTLSYNHELPVLKLRHALKPDTLQPSLPSKFDAEILKDRDLLLGSTLSRKRRRDVIHLAHDAESANERHGEALKKFNQSFGKLVPDYTSNDNYELYMNAVSIFYLASIILGEVEESCSQAVSSEDIIKEIDAAKEFSEREVGVSITLEG